MTTITASSSIGIDLGIAIYASPVVIGSGVTISNRGYPDAVYTAKGGGTVFTIRNEGTVIGSSVGINLAPGGSVTNAASASVTGYTAIGIYGRAGTVFNDGIVAANFAGIYLAAGGTVTNGTSASIAADLGNSVPYPHGYGVSMAGAGVVVNAGDIIGARIGINLAAGGSVTNAASGDISGGFNAIYFEGNAGTVVNHGTIDPGILLFAGGSVTNTSAGTIISAYAVDFFNDAGTVLNDGVISSGHPVSNYGFPYGIPVALNVGGSVTNGASGSIQGVLAGVFIQVAAGTVINAGSISASNGPGIEFVAGSIGSVTNAANGSIKGYTSGVYLSAGGTVVNGGLISGHDGYAISFSGTGSNLLELEPSYGFSGVVSGSTGGTNTLELTSAASAGTVTGLGTEILHFGSIVFDPGAQWSIEGVQRGLAGPISGFAVGDTIDFQGITVTGSYFSNGFLSLYEAVGSVSLDLRGSFTNSDFVVTNVPGGAEITTTSNNNSVPPTISGTVPNQAVTDPATIEPFSGAVITDTNVGQLETVTVTLSDAANGTLVDLFGGSFNAATGVYTDIDSADDVTVALQNLVFEPDPYQVAPGLSVTTGFTISDTDTADETATDSTTSVIATAGTVAPTISGTAANQMVATTATIDPFTDVAITDPNIGQTETVTVTLSEPANGTLTNGGIGTYNPTTGTYTVVGNALTVSYMLDELVFVPATGRLAPGQSDSTSFTIVDGDTAGAAASNQTTSVITTAGTLLPQIVGIYGGVTVTTPGKVDLFPGILIIDQNAGQTETVTVTLSDPANGTLYGPGNGTYDAATGVYTDAGTTAAVNTALENLTFDPNPNLVAPGQTVTTEFTVTDTDTAGASVINNNATVFAVAGTLAPAISGTTQYLMMNDPATTTPFANVSVTDANVGQTETLTVALSVAANGALSNLGGGSYDAASGVYSVVGSAASVTTSLDHLIFTPSMGLDWPAESITTFTITDTDTAGGSTRNDLTTVVAVAANPLPFITAGGTAAYSAGGPAVTLDAELTISDLESTTLVGATVGISGMGFQPADILNLGTTVPGIAASYDAQEGVLTLSGTASLAAYQTALDAVTYSAAGGDPTDGGFWPDRMIDWTVNDGTTTASATSDLSVSFAGDPAADIELENTSGQMAIWRLNGSTPSAWGFIGQPAGPTWSAMAIGGFFPGDTADIAWQTPAGTAIWQVDGTAVVNKGTVNSNPGSTWHIRGAANFYNDGQSDLIWQGDNGQVVLWDMNGTAIVQGGNVADPGAAWLVKGAADFYGDGNTDILLQNQDGQAAIWDMEGASIVQGGLVAANPGPSWYIVGTGDFYGDGNSDIVWQSADGQIAIWDMNGTSIEQGGIVASDPGSSWHVIGTGDFNNDGMTDLVLQNENGSVVTWEMDGTAVIGGGMVADPGVGWSIIGGDTMRFILSGAGGETIAAAPATPDEFVFTAAAPGAHTITGFNAVQDIVELPGWEFPTFAAVQAATSSAAGGALVNLGDGATLLLAGIDPSALHASNFALT